MTKLRNIRPMVAPMDARVASPPSKRVDAHYLTAGHQVWRREVMKRARWRCQANDCPKPGASGRLFADHITELQDGGDPFDPANGQALCGSCHSRKTSEARAERMARPT